MTDKSKNWNVYFGHYPVDNIKTPKYTVWETGTDYIISLRMNWVKRNNIIAKIERNTFYLQARGMETILGSYVCEMLQQQKPDIVFILTIPLPDSIDELRGVEISGQQYPGYWKFVLKKLLN